MSSLTSSIEPMGVPTSSGYAMLLLPMVMCIQLALSPSLVGPCKHLGVGDFPAAVGWDLAVRNREEGVGAVDALALVRTSANALA